MEQKEVPVPAGLHTFLWNQVSLITKGKVNHTNLSNVFQVFESLLRDDARGQTSAENRTLSEYQRLDNPTKIKTVLPCMVSCCGHTLTRKLRQEYKSLHDAEEKMIDLLGWVLCESPFIHRADVLVPSLELRDVQMFVFTFTPLLEVLRCSEVESRLSYKDCIWDPIGAHSLPRVTPFCQAACLLSDCAPSGLATATIFDVAVLRCLFVVDWSEKGAIWALVYLSKYLHQLLINSGVSEEMIRLFSTGNPTSGGQQVHAGPQTTSESRPHWGDSPELGMPARTIVYSSVSPGCSREDAIFLPGCAEFVNSIGHLSILAIIRCIRLVLVERMSANMVRPVVSVMLGLVQYAEVCLPKASHYYDSAETTKIVGCLFECLSTMLCIIGCPSCSCNSLPGLNTAEFYELVIMLVQKLLSSYPQESSVWMSVYASTDQPNHILRYLHTILIVCEVPEFMTARPRGDGLLSASSQTKVERTEVCKLSAFAEQAIMDAITRPFLLRACSLDDLPSRPWFMELCSFVKYTNVYHPALVRRVALNFVILATQVSLSMKQNPDEPTGMPLTSASSSRSPDLVRPSESSFGTPSGLSLTTIKAALKWEKVLQAKNSKAFFKRKMSESTLSSVSKQHTSKCSLSGTNFAAMFSRDAQYPNHVRKSCSCVENQASCLTSDLHLDILRLRNLLQCSLPGSVPEPQVLSFLFKMDAPTIAKSILILELAHFVHQFSRQGGNLMVKMSEQLNVNQGPLTRLELQFWRQEASRMLSRWAVCTADQCRLLVTNPNVEAGTPESMLRDLLAISCMFLLVEIVQFLRAASQVAPKDTPRRRLARRRSRRDLPSTYHRDASSVTDTTTRATVNLAGSCSDINGSLHTKVGLSTSNTLSQRHRLHHLSAARNNTFSNRTEHPRVGRTSPHGSVVFDDMQPLDSLEPEEKKFLWVQAIITFQSVSSGSCVHINDDDSRGKLSCMHCIKLLCWKSFHLITAFYQDMELDMSLSVPAGQQNDLQLSMVSFLQDKVAGLVYGAPSLISNALFFSDSTIYLQALPVLWDCLGVKDSLVVSRAAITFLVAAQRLPMAATALMLQNLGMDKQGSWLTSARRISKLWGHRYEVIPYFSNLGLSVPVPAPNYCFTVPAPQIGSSAPEVIEAGWRVTERSRTDANSSGDYFLDPRDVEIKQRQISLENRRSVRITHIPIILDASISTDIKSLQDDKVVCHSQLFDRPFLPSALLQGIHALCRLLVGHVFRENFVTFTRHTKALILRFMRDDPAAFFRAFFEGDFHKNSKDILLLLRKLLSLFYDIPTPAATHLFNCLLGYGVSLTRVTSQTAPRGLTEVTLTMSEIVRHLDQLPLHELRHLLKRDSCEASFLVPNNQPAVQNLYVKHDSSTRCLSVVEDMTFGQLLDNCRKLFSIQGGDLYLVDSTQEVIPSGMFVRSYFVQKPGLRRRLLSLVELDSQIGQERTREQVIVTKLHEISKLLLTQKLFARNRTEAQSVYLYAELLKNPLFIQDMLGIELNNLENASKDPMVYTTSLALATEWVKFLGSVLLSLSSSHIFGEDIRLFLCAIAGCFLMYHENKTLAQTCLSTLLSYAVNMPAVFVYKGFSYIMPSIVKTYCICNSVIKHAIEFVVSCFFGMYPRSFSLQLFNSVSPHIFLSMYPGAGDCFEISSESFFQLLLSLEFVSKDDLGILDMLKITELPNMENNQTPEPGHTSKVEWLIRLCTLLIDYAPDSQKAVHMLIILRAIAPRYMEHVQSSRQDSDEALSLKLVTRCVACVLTSLNKFSRPYHHGSPWPTTQRTGHREFGEGNEVEMTDLQGLNDEPNEGLSLGSNRDLDLYVYSRDLLLGLTANVFGAYCHGKGTGEGSQNNLSFLKPKAVQTLCLLVQQLLTLSTKHPFILSLGSIQMTIGQCFPYIDFSSKVYHELIESVFSKIGDLIQVVLKRPVTMVNSSWNSYTQLFAGINQLLMVQPALADSVLVMRQFLFTLLRLLMGEFAAHNFAGVSQLRSSSSFNAVVIHFAHHLYDSPSRSTTLKELCCGRETFKDTAALCNYMMLWFIPLCLEIRRSHSQDRQGLGHADLKYAVGMVLSMLVPRPGWSGSSSPGRQLMRSVRFSLNAEDIRPKPQPVRSRFDLDLESHCVLFLALKVLVYGHTEQLWSMWHSIKCVLLEFSRDRGSEPAWCDFLVFCFTHWTPLTILLQPYVMAGETPLTSSDGTLARLKSLILSHRFFTRNAQIMDSLVLELARLSQRGVDRVPSVSLVTHIKQKDEETAVRPQGGPSVDQRLATSF